MLVNLILNELEKEDCYFFEDLLANISNNPTEVQLQLIEFANNELGKKLSLKKCDRYLLVNIEA